MDKKPPYTQEEANRMEHVEQPDNETADALKEAALAKARADIVEALQDVKAEFKKMLWQNFVSFAVFLPLDSLLCLHLYNTWLLPLGMPELSFLHVMGIQITLVAWLFLDMLVKLELIKGKATPLSLRVCIFLYTRGLLLFVSSVLAAFL